MGSRDTNTEKQVAQFSPTANSRTYLQTAEAGGSTHAALSGSPLRPPSIDPIERLVEILMARMEEDER